MQSENRKHKVHDSALQGNPGANPLQDMIHDPKDNLFKRMHKHINKRIHKYINMDMNRFNHCAYINIKYSDCKCNKMTTVYHVRRARPRSWYTELVIPRSPNQNNATVIIMQVCLY